MKRILTLAMFAAIAVTAFSLTAYHKVFEATYNITKDSNLGKHPCEVCHMTAKGGGKLNPYGKDVQAAMKTAHTKKLTADILKSVENLDSVKDGVKNITRIKKDKLPGGNKPE